MMTDKTVAVQRHKNAFNAIRGMGALFIMFSHMSFMAASDNSVCVNIYKYFMQHGYVWTSFFYICAGFFASYAYRENKSFKTYIGKKLKKIYPIALFVFLLALVLDLFMPGGGINEIRPDSGLYYVCIFLNLSMLKAFVPVEKIFYSFHGPSWFLSALFIFYVIAYWLLPLIKNQNTRKKTLKYTAIVCGIAYFAQLIICILVETTALHGNSLWLSYVNPFFRIFGECLLGILLCELLPELFSKIKCNTLVEIIAVVVCFVLYLSMDFFNSSIQQAWFQAVPFSLLLFAFYGDSGKISKLLSTKPLQGLGDISFELYMTHAFVYEGMPVALSVIGLGDWIVSHAGIRFIITIPVCLVFAYVVHWTIGKMTQKKHT